MTRGNHCREEQEGLPPTAGTKGDKARQYDGLVRKVQGILKLVKQSAMENPAAGLEFAEVMEHEEGNKLLVELCVFVWPFKKRTSIWISGFEWMPAGVTGDGRCHS